MVAVPARAAVWVIPATARAFPSTAPGSAQTIELDAAGNEYEGVQVVVRRAAARNVQLSSSADSDALITDNATLSQVAWYPYPVPQANVFDFPKHAAKAGAFDKACRQLAVRIELAR